MSDCEAFISAKKDVERRAFAARDLWLAVGFSVGGLIAAGICSLTGDRAASWIFLAVGLFSSAKLCSITYNLYFLTRPINLLCPTCKEHISSQWVWGCGYCQTYNDRNVYSWLHRCEHCKNPPKSFRCPNSECEHIIFLDKERDGVRPAFKKGTERAPATKPDVRKIREAEVAEIKHNILRASLNAKYAEEERKLRFFQPEPVEILSSEDKLKRELKQRRDKQTLLKRLCHEQKLEDEKVYKGNADLIRDLHDDTDLWYEEMLQKKSTGESAF